MGLLGSNNEAFTKVVQDVFKSSYGIIYVEEDWEIIKKEYIERDETGGMILDAKITHREIKNKLNELAEDSDSPIEKVRDSVFFLDLISMGTSDEDGLNTIRPKLVSLFKNKAIIDKKTLLDEFGVSSDDDDFFISPLMERDYLEQIKTGADSYYVIGDFLTENYDTQTITEQLIEKSSGGTVSHSELSRVISVEAKEDVINYLETTENIVLDLGGEFLILEEETINSFAHSRANEIESDIENTLEKAGYILPVEELEHYIEDDLENKKHTDYPDVLNKAENVNKRDKIVDKTIEYIVESLQLTEDSGLYLMAGFDAYVKEMSESAVDNAQREEPSSDQEWEDLAMQKINKDEIDSSPLVVDYFEEKARNEISIIIDKKFGGGE